MFAYIVVFLLVWGLVRYYRSLPPSSRGNIIPIRLDPYLNMSATDLAQRLRDGEITSVELVEKCLRHCLHINDGINALAYVRQDAAKKEAQAADLKLNAARRNKTLSSLPPFLGVPCTVKEVFANVGHEQTAGHVRRVGHDPVVEDATVVARMKAAGFIVLCGTNVSELCMWMECNNPVYGLSCNPYDYRRITGGSSGGEGALVSGCGVPVGIGSDIGGSIRLPSFFNGIFGHKPTSRTVPNSGQYPMSTGEASKYLCTGPMCRHATDLYPLLKILRGPDERDLLSTEHMPPLKSPSEVSSNLRNLKVYVIPWIGSLGTRVSEDELDSLHKAALHLNSLGCIVQYVYWDKPSTVPPNWSLIRNSFDIWGSMMTQNPVPFQDLMANGKPFSPGWELLRWFWGSSPHTIPAIALCLLEKTYSWFPARTKRYIDMGKRLQESISAELGENGIILMPTYTMAAPHHYRPILLPIQWQYTAIWNTMELPVSQIPMGLNAQGLPVGIQCV
eukprot:PhF_6_TR44525/c0_g1_i2/m.68585/K19176/FAAH2; fatty acid amide hydrolase 2